MFRADRFPEPMAGDDGAGTRDLRPVNLCPRGFGHWLGIPNQLVRLRPANGVASFPEGSFKFVRGCFLHRKRLARL